MAGLSVAENLKNLKARIAEVARESGRDPESVHILGVGKRQPLNKIREAYESGLRDFAENYVQEALPKLEQLHSLPARWHFIGRLQSNKVKLLARRFAVIHSLDRVSLAEALNRLPHVDRQDVFLQYNVAAEASKGGAGDDELFALAQYVFEKCPKLRVLGLMSMPPLDALARQHFRKTRERLEELKRSVSPSVREAHPLDQLSMGTSQDFADAIREGATWIRIGTDLFGAREEKE